MLAARVTAMDRAATDAGRFLALQAIVADFEGLSDVSAYSARAVILGKEKSVKDALKRARDEDDREIRIIREIQSPAGGLGDGATRQDALVELDRMFRELNGAARRAADSMERRVARRLMATIAGNTAFTTDPDLLALIAKYRVPRTR